eukprot:c16995_g1_i1.p1 GENE.c16995_g1_i1~~c16995_g1_i1.p1  ORF type:complete len:297 (+),score=55.24 c16995_g1_i1:350-1240(+)
MTLAFALSIAVFPVAVILALVAAYFVLDWADAHEHNLYFDDGVPIDKWRHMLPLSCLTLTVLIFAYTAAIVCSQFIPVLVDLTNTDSPSHYFGPVPSLYSAAVADSRVRWYHFNSTAIEYSNVGDRILFYMSSVAKRIRAAPLRERANATAVKTNIPVWACDCMTAPYGCHAAPIIRYSRQMRGDYFVDNWTPGHLTAARIQNAHGGNLKDSCVVSARRSAVSRNNGAAIAPPINSGAVFVELVDFGFIEYRLKVAITTVLVVLNSVGLLFAFGCRSLCVSVILQSNCYNNCLDGK